MIGGFQRQLQDGRNFNGNIEMAKPNGNIEMAKLNGNIEMAKPNGNIEIT